MNDQFAPAPMRRRQKSGLGYRGERRSLARARKINWRALPRLLDPKQRGTRIVEIRDKTKPDGVARYQINTYTFRVGGAA